MALKALCSISSTRACGSFIMLAQAAASLLMGSPASSFSLNVSVSCMELIIQLLSVLRETAIRWGGGYTGEYCLPKRTSCCLRASSSSVAESRAFLMSLACSNGCSRESLVKMTLPGSKSGQHRCRCFEKTGHLRDFWVQAGQQNASASATRSIDANFRFFPMLTIFFLLAIWGRDAADGRPSMCADS